MRVLWRAAWAAMLFLATGTGARADLLYGFSGNVPDGPVDATVSFTLGNGTVHIVVNSLLANPTSDGQLVSGIDFTISGAASTGSLTDATGLISYIDTSNGKYTAGVSQGLTQAAVTHHSVWALTEAGELTTLSATKPEFLIIGPDDKGSFTNVGLYSAANSSIFCICSLSRYSYSSSLALTLSIAVMKALYHAADDLPPLKRSSCSLAALPTSTAS